MPSLWSEVDLDRLAANMDSPGWVALLDGPPTKLAFPEHVSQPLHEHPDSLWALVRTFWRWVRWEKSPEAQNWKVGTEPADPLYARQPLSQDGFVTFPAATVPWDVRYIALYDAAADGELLWWRPQECRVEPGTVLHAAIPTTAYSWETRL